MSKKVKIGVFGVGYLGKIHLKLLKEIEGFDIVGFYDPDDAISEEVKSQFQIIRFEKTDDLIKACDAIDIVAPTQSHYEIGIAALKKARHIFTEKPLAATVKQARELVKLAGEAGIRNMVGHVERFNPALLALGDYKVNPLFIEVHRLAQFNPRGTDVSVVFDLMIHDLDIILSLVKANVKSISASGVAIVTDSPDIANARIEFDNGCVVNITSSRISLKVMRKMRIFQPGAYISMDFHERKTEIVTIADKISEKSGFPPMEIETGKGKKYISYDLPEIKDSNAIKMELETFLDCIQKKKECPVSFEDGLKAMELAQTINDKINRQLVQKEKYKLVKKGEEKN